jgi:porin
MAFNFYNTTSLTAMGVWTPANWVTIAGGVLDPNSRANNFATDAFDKVNIYTLSIFSHKVGGLPGQSWAEFNWTNKPKVDLGSPFGPLSPPQIPQAVGVLLGSPSTAGLPIHYKPESWVVVANTAQYFLTMEGDAATAPKLRSGQPLRGIGGFGRFGYAPEVTNPISRHASFALFAHGLWARRKFDSFGAGFYYNAVSSELKQSIEQLTAGTAAVNDEKGTEIFYDFAITPAIRLTPSYQHIWNPLAADVSTKRSGADIFLARVTVVF